MTDATDMKIRVWVPEVWDSVELPVSLRDSFAHVKSASLRQATGRCPDPADYDLKFRGAVVIDESRTLEDLAVPNGAPMIVVPAHRRPVR